MARVGMNPARHRTSKYKPAKVTVAVLVYLPQLSGYFEHRFDVLKLCLMTLLKHTQAPYDLLVFDNASCKEVKQYLDDLLRAGAIRYLINSSENIGKLGALRVIAGAAPGELIAYTDDDTFFYPGWLSAHLEVYYAFPNVGMVSGSPERTLFDHGIESNLRLAEKDPEVEVRYGQTIPEEWEWEWGFSLGKDADHFLTEVRELEDIVIERRGKKAYATACHNQFLIPKEVALEFLSEGWSGRLMGGMNELDNAIDSAGYLRLTTMDRTTRLIGNLVSPMLAKEAKRFQIEVDALSKPMRAARQSLLMRWKPTRWLLQGLYNRLFWLLNEGVGGWYEKDTGSE